MRKTITSIVATLALLLTFTSCNNDIIKLITEEVPISGDTVEEDSKMLKGNWVLKNVGNGEEMIDGEQHVVNDGSPIISNIESMDIAIDEDGISQIITLNFKRITNVIEWRFINGHLETIEIPCISYTFKPKEWYFTIELKSLNDKYGSYTDTPKLTFKNAPSDNPYAGTLDFTLYGYDFDKIKVNRLIWYINSSTHYIYYEFVPNKKK